ncbi:CBS domain containing-hemolysin-like protein [Fontibacillus phaseoli]|uniref:CBS domain containing-hemolysin-like protein n=1 Tax=Fontibacillus phaseoli TaxID=1416533 RepID=A0A369B6W2_9BACL|nr:hemolysin family protein [Fontibacillus phaseoli]RCX17065.1 CBS domain containing-hemolysin-like protein [Fontibacillus phaseoli]
MFLDGTLLSFLLVITLVALTSFFVVAEYSIRRLRAGRVDILLREGRRAAVPFAKLMRRPQQALSACQLGVTMTSLILGWLGQPLAKHLLQPLFLLVRLPEKLESILSFVIAFLVITYLHVVLGALVPRMLAAQKGETFALAASRPLLWFATLMSPLVWLLNRSSGRIVSLLGLRAHLELDDAHSEEELQALLSASLEQGEINSSEYNYLSRIFAFDELSAKDIMVPRTDMVCLYANKSREENLEIIKAEQYTRFPVIRENKDDIIGVINTKQLFLIHEDEPDAPLESLVRPVMTASENISLTSLLSRMQKERSHIALLIDEYGGTSGMITIEDLLEEIVGDIRDEFDAEEEQEIMILEENHFIVDGKVSISHINDLLLTELEDDDTDTIGGWVYGQDMDIEEGTVLNYGDLSFTVLERVDSRIRKIEIEKAVADDAENIEGI